VMNEYSFISIRVTDIRALGTLLKEFDITFSVDNTMMTSLMQRPLDLGADIVVHSGTKFISGSSALIHHSFITHSSLIHYSFITHSSLNHHSFITHSSLTHHSLITHSSLIHHHHHHVDPSLCRTRWYNFRCGYTTVL